MVSARAVAVAAVVWVGLHLVLLVHSLEESSQPILYIAAAVVAVGATSVALAPLLGRPASLRRSQAITLAAVYVAVAMTVTPTLSPAGFVGYANWWPGAMAPLLTALVLRRHALAALVAATGGTAALTVGAVLTQPPGERLGPVVALAFPLAIWPLGGSAFRAVFDRADQVVSDLRQGTARSLAKTQRGEIHDLAAARVLDEAVPLLAKRAAGRTPTEGDEHRAQDVERTIRDEIRGGRLLDAVTRDRARLLRAKGWHVAIDDHGAHGVVAPAEDEHADTLVSDLAHATMLTCLQASKPGRLELTAPVDAGTRLTLLVCGPKAVLDAVEAAANEVVDRHHRLRPDGFTAEPALGEGRTGARHSPPHWSLQCDRDEPEQQPGVLWIGVVGAAGSATT